MLIAIGFALVFGVGVFIGRMSNAAKIANIKKVVNDAEGLVSADVARFAAAVKAHL